MCSLVSISGHGYADVGVRDSLFAGIAHKGLEATKGSINFLAEGECCIGIVPDASLEHIPERLNTVEIW